MKVTVMAMGTAIMVLLIVTIIMIMDILIDIIPMIVAGIFIKDQGMATVISHETKSQTI
jgi:hypothetical protein